MWGRGEVHAGSLWGDLREGNHLEDPGIDGGMILKQIFKKWGGGSIDQIDLAHDRDMSEVLVNAVMNLWDSLLGKILLYELVSFLPVQEILLWSVCVCCQEVLYLPVSQDQTVFSLYSQKVLKYADTNIIEFQSSRRNISLKIHADIFVLKSSAVLKYFYSVSQLLLHDPSDLDNHFDFNILLKIHANIFVLKSSAVLKCFCSVSQLLLHDPSDLDNHFDFMTFVSVNSLS